MFYQKLSFSKIILYKITKKATLSPSLRLNKIKHIKIKYIVLSYKNNAPMCLVMKEFDVLAGVKYMKEKKKNKGKHLSPSETMS